MFCNQNQPMMSAPSRITLLYLNIFLEKNSNGTKNLRLKGNELYFRIRQRISTSDMPTICRFIKTQPEIVKLEFAHNNIEDLGLKILIKEVLSKPNNIEHLNLLGCNITSAGLKSLASAIPTLKLKTLRVTANPIGRDGGIYFEQFLLNMPSLQHLDAGDSHQTLASIPYFCSALRSDIGDNETLKVLDISNVIAPSEYYQTSPAHLADQVGEMIKMNSTLVELHLQKCQFDGHDVQLLLLGLRPNTTLLLLDLGYNRINNFGAEELATWLETRPALQGLNIAGNSIGDYGATALKYGVPYSSLKLLDVSANKIGDLALSELLISMKKKIRMRVLYIWGNTIGPKSLKVLQRHMGAGLYEQQYCDFKLFEVDGKLQAAFYPSDGYKKRFYCQLEHEDVQELRIKRNEIFSEYCDERAKLNFKFYDRIQGRCVPPGDISCMKW